MFKKLSKLHMNCPFVFKEAEERKPGGWGGGGWVDGSGRSSAVHGGNRSIRIETKN
jgi:hypothetical protein